MNYANLSQQNLPFDRFFSAVCRCQKTEKAIEINRGIPGQSSPRTQTKNTAAGEADLASLSVRPSYVAPRTQEEGELVKLWQDIFCVEGIGVHDNFFELGGDSLHAVRMVTQANEIGLLMDHQDLAENLTIAELAAALGDLAVSGKMVNAIGSASDSLLVPIKTRGVKSPLFLVHPLLGATFPYVQLGHLLGKYQPVYAIRALGLEEGEQPLSSIKAMATRYINEIRTIQPEGPYRLGGWSLGGWVAYEMAHQLSTLGHQIDLLALVDTPYRSHSEGFMRKFHRGLTFSWLLMREIWPYVRYYQELIAGAKPANSNNHPRLPIWQEPIYRRTLEIYKAGLQAIWSYQPTSYRGRMILLRAEEQYFHQEKDLGWGNLDAVEMDVVQVPGNHMTILREPNVRMLARLIQKTAGKNTDGL